MGSKGETVHSFKNSKVSKGEIGGPEKRSNLIGCTEFIEGSNNREASCDSSGMGGISSDEFDEFCNSNIPTLKIPIN